MFWLFDLGFIVFFSLLTDLVPAFFFLEHFLCIYGKQTIAITRIKKSAVLVSIIAMMLFAGSIGAFVQRHPTIKMLALSFLLLIGTTLIAEGLEFHIPKGYVYFAMAFSVFVEILNIRLRKKVPPVHLHSQFSDEDEQAAVRS